MRTVVLLTMMVLVVMVASCGKAKQDKRQITRAAGLNIGASGVNVVSLNTEIAVNVDGKVVYLKVDDATLITYSIGPDATKSADTNDIVVVIKR